MPKLRRLVPDRLLPPAQHVARLPLNDLQGLYIPQKGTLVTICKSCRHSRGEHTINLRQYVDCAKRNALVPVDIPACAFRDCAGGAASQIAELLRIHHGRHDTPCDVEALRELLDNDDRPALAQVVGGSPFPRLTDDGVRMIGELVSTWETLI